MTTNEPSTYQVGHETLRQYIVDHIMWSTETFGPGPHFEGLIKHIQKECIEVQEAHYKGKQGLASPKDVLMELVDIVILSIDAMWRLGFTAEEVTAALIEKQNINKKRKYPKITDPAQPTEHIKEEVDEPK